MTIGPKGRKKKKKELYITLVCSDLQQNLQIAGADWQMSEVECPLRLQDVVIHDEDLETSAMLTLHYTQTTAQHHIINF